MTYAIENITNLNITDIGGLLQATNTYSNNLYGIGLFFIIYLASFIVTFHFSGKARESLLFSSFTAILTNWFLYNINILSLWWSIIPGLLLAASLFIQE